MENISITNVATKQKRLKKVSWNTRQFLHLFCTYLKIFQETEILLNHLQKSYYDIVTASVIIYSTTERLKMLQNKRLETVNIAYDFIMYCKEQLSETEIELEKELKTK